MPSNWRTSIDWSLVIKFLVMLVVVTLCVAYNIWVYNAVGYHIDFNIVWPVVMIAVFVLAFWLIKNFGGQSALLAGLVLFVVTVLVGVMLFAASNWVGWASLRDSLITTSAIVFNVIIVWLAARGLPGDIEFGKHKRTTPSDLSITTTS